MRKKVWLLVSLMMLSFSLPPPCRTETAEPEGFGGIRWQEEASRVAGLRPKGVSDHLLVYRRVPELTHYGGAALEEVEYYFYFGKFMGARLSLRGVSNFTLLKKHLIATYGPGTQRNYFLSRFTWLFPSVLMSLGYISRSDSASLLYCYLPLWRQMEENEQSPLPLHPLP